MKLKQILYLSVFVVIALSCTTKSTDSVSRPSFSGDSAYAYVQDQMTMGPRVPNSLSHTICAAYLVEHLRNAGAEVTLQRGVMKDYSGRDQQIINVIGRFGGNACPALLLCAHYDTRPWTDEEDNYEDRYYNVPGANDGASGVAVLLEVARQIGLMTDSVRMLRQPVEFVFFDCEDMGTPQFYTGAQREDTWCLGSQLWASNCVPADYQYGVLLDMVGAPDATFPREYYSVQSAENYVEKIWRAAAALGHGRFFSTNLSYPITDDHVYVNRVGIPCVDIIHYNMNNASGFPSWWHTRHDDMSNVSVATLQAVGETVMSLIQ